MMLINIQKKPVVVAYVASLRTQQAAYIINIIDLNIQNRLVAKFINLP